MSATPPPVPPPPDPGDPLAKFWNKPVSELATVCNSAISPEQAERHTIYCLTTLSLVRKFWNGNKRGQDGEYPWRASQKRANGTYAGDQFGDRYLGHNIACIAVDKRGEVIDFDFNHNDLYSSSAEHAEARLIRRIFSLDQIYDGWQTENPSEILPIDYSTILNGVALYTSLESCAQCSGIMTLANLDKVIFVQSDPGQYLIGNIMYNFTAKPATLTPGSAAAKYGAPEPVDANVFGFTYKEELDRKFKDFKAQVIADPQNKFFYKSPDGAYADKTPSITSFLCADVSLDVFTRAAAELDAFEPKFPAYKPASSPADPKMLSNQAVLAHVRQFLTYAKIQGRRGTPHK